VPNEAGPAFNRRMVMKIGTVGGLGLSSLLQSLAEANERGSGTFGRSKRLMLLYLQGAASQLETWDPKPDAPVEIRGQHGVTSTAVPGTFICDGLPKMAKRLDRVAIVRSMTHPHNNHSNHYTLTGYPTVNFASETNPRDDRHHPFFGSVLDYLHDADNTATNDPAAHGVPGNIGLPWRFSRHALIKRAGPYGAFLGSGYDPVWTDLRGQATKEVGRVSFFGGGKTVKVRDPFLGVTHDSRLLVSKDMQLRADLPMERLDQRLTLVEQLDRLKRHVNQDLEMASLDRYQAMAYSLLTSEKLRSALDVGQETSAKREQYGMTLFGQSVLTGRRLLEAGSRLVSVFWDEYKVVNTAWDTHFNHFSRLSDELLPGYDAAVSTLIDDLEERGMLDDTLVMCLTEHGRTPKIGKLSQGGGRDHWSRVYSVMLFGGGISPGAVVGASDERGAFVADRPTSPEDILTTMYHLMGVPPQTTIPDQLGRPIWLTQQGRKIDELVGG
jgi:hypothetical protein